jgi:outer membrane protein OmpA-like peptidoglycan-associated protein
VALDCLKDAVAVGETTPCTATARDPDGDPLTYAWATTAGRVTGTGPTVILETAGTVCDSAITVRVTVNDGRGGTATATDVVRVVCPRAQKAESVTCTSSGFPRNLARLNNVDKACLDDVAARLRQDPRSRVVVVGHADPRESHPDVLGRKRAEAVKAYLVKERGIEEARVSARTAGATRSLGATGQGSWARNSRVEIVFLPEGTAYSE